ncbi:MAG TPA: ATP-binding protein, partial [Vicinamibacterales bacterium]|nr:ATP-binding protein [Vicinamibacterales bacterium]
ARLASYAVAINVFGFLAVAALAGSLAENLRRTGARLERASKEIEDLQAFNQDVIDSLTSGLITTDIDGRILTVNRAAEEILGLTSAGLIDHPLAEVLQLPREVAGTIASGLPGQRSYRAEFFHHRDDGTAIEIGMAAAHLIAPGGQAGFLITFQDVTEVKRLDRDARVRQRLAAVGEMAAGMAHEIRNPLASIAGSVQVLREELPLKPEQAELLDIVLHESKRLNGTIRGFLAYARPQPAATERIDLRKAVTNTALLLRNSAEVREGQELVADLPPDPVWYDADEGQVQQVLWNLASNGLRAMPSGGRLTLSVRGGPPAPGRADARHDAIIEVKDEGVGIPPEQLDRIFQPFHGTFARGSGLGLAIVHRIVSEYHGQIDIRSAEGQGTTVTVRLGDSGQPDR